MKYKLIKEYPGSPKLGFITDRTMYFPEYYPSFWQPVVEKNYEILSLVASEKNPQHKKGSKFLHNKDYKFKNMHPTEFWNIYSVKRLSDGEIFTIGDKTNFGLISKIVINNNSLSFYFEQKSCGYNLQTLIKWKQLFTTEDGVDIFKGDKYWKVNNYLNLSNRQKATGSTSDLNPAKYFSTKEKAEEYILMNKPCLSLNDIENAMDQTSYLISSKLNKFRDYLKSKIQQSV